MMLTGGRMVSPACPQLPQPLSAHSKHAQEHKGHDQELAQQLQEFLTLSDPAVQVPTLSMPQTEELEVESRIWQASALEAARGQPAAGGDHLGALRRPAL